MVVRMRHTRGHTRNRRSHHALSARAASICANCGARSMPHRACAACGFYKGREVINVLAKTTKKATQAGEKKGGKVKPEKRTGSKEEVRAEKRAHIHQGK